MPFTISHAAAALPVHALSRARLPLAALMVGSMAPDFAYFVPWKFTHYDTHSFVGLFTFSLPLGLIAWLYFVLLLERPTLAFLPDAWRTRITPTETPGARSLLMGAIAIVLGAMTHIVWDAFTHSSTPVVEALPGLRSTLFDVDGVYVPVYFVLQVMSSVFGLAALLAWANGIRRRPARPREEIVAALSPQVTGFERVLAVLFMAAASCAGAFFYVARFDRFTGESTLFYLLIGGMAGTAAAWSVLAVAIRFRSRTLRLFAQPDAD